jgi:hypothetical protein
MSHLREAPAIESRLEPREHLTCGITDEIALTVSRSAR